MKPQNKTITDDLYRRLADDVISGRLAPGTRLEEQALADKFRVSRTPVREALGQLAAAGLAEKEPHRGVFIKSITPRQLDEMFEYMAELEASCARLAAERMTTDERRRLMTMHETTRGLSRAGTPDDYEKQNLEFHALLYQGAHNSHLEEVTFLTRKRLAPFRRAQFRVLGRLANSFREHDLVVSAIIRGDGAGAAEAMRSHMLTVGTASQDYLTGHGEADEDLPAAG